MAEVLKSKLSLRNEWNLMNEGKDFLLDATGFSKSMVVEIFMHPGNNEGFLSRRYVLGAVGKGKLGENTK